MAKTDSLIINCDRVEISSLSGGRNRLSVDIMDLKIAHVLDDIHNDDIIEWCQSNLMAEDIFTTAELEKWAEANGYTKETN